LRTMLPCPTPAQLLPLSISRCSACSLFLFRGNKMEGN
jgi:hypothetical protein